MGPETDALIPRYSSWLRDRYGGTTYRVSVDAGFTCPVREAGLPCAYCDAGGSRAPYLGDLEALSDQISRGVRFLASRYHADRFLLYFQAYSNTYAPVAELRRVYDHALSRGDFVGMVVATRPDCVDEPRARLLREYVDRGLDVWVELGLQTANDRTLRRIRRGHTVARFDEAVRLLAGYGINTAAHLILGLPGEGIDEAVASVRHVSRLPVGGVKFHNLVAVAGTPLYDEYARGEFSPPGAERYRALLTAALEHLRGDVIVMRLTCDPPRGVEHAPSDLPDKRKLYDEIVADFAERGVRQGIYWGVHADEG